MSQLARFLPGGQIVEVPAIRAAQDAQYASIPQRVPNGMVERNAMRVGALAPNAIMPGGPGVRIASVAIPWATGAIGRAVGGDTGEVVGEVVGGFMSPSGERPAAETAGRFLRRYARPQGAIDSAYLEGERTRQAFSGVGDAATFADTTNRNGRAVIGRLAGQGYNSGDQINEFARARETNLPDRVATATRQHVSPTPVRAPGAVETVPPGEAGAAVSTAVNTSRDTALRNVDRAYDVAREAGAERLLAPRTEIPVVRETLQQAVVNGWDEQTAPAVYREIESLTSRQDMTVEDLMRSRTRLTNLAADTANPVQASAARAARRALDAEITRLEPLVQNPSPSGPRTLTAGAPTPDSGADAIAAWRRAQRRRARFGRQYEGGDLLERLTAREVRGGENNVQVIPPEGASAAMIGSAAGTVRVDGNTARDLRRLRTRLGPNSPEWRAFQDEATDRLMGNDPARYGERFADFETRYRSRGLVDLLVPPARQAELRAARGEEAGRRLIAPSGDNALDGITPAQLQDARNAAAGAIEAGVEGTAPDALITRLQTPAVRRRLAGILGSDGAVQAFTTRLAAEQELVRNAQEISPPPTPQMSDAPARLLQGAQAATNAVQGARHLTIFSPVVRWATTFHVKPEDADRITAAVLDPAQTDAILREVRQGYGPAAERAMRGIIRRARRNVGTAGSVMGAPDGNAE